MIATPDFVVGVMEIWGQITYRETAMLFKTSRREGDRERIVENFLFELVLRIIFLCTTVLVQLFRQHFLGCI